MHLHHLCFIFPSDGDDIHPFHHHKTSKPPPSSPPPQSKPRSCGIHIRNTLHKFLTSKRDIKFCGFCSKPPRAIFHDTDGVQFAKETSVGAHSPKTFTYSELYIATKGFSQDQILGSGGFGRVFRAVLPSDGTVAAVKCLTETGDRFEKSFAAELVAVAHLRHRNLVPLRGWCVNNDQLLLVYDYMPNRSLDRLLFRRVGNNGNVAEPVFSWEKRMRIVKGLAAALFYLHEQLEAQIIHRDVKTSNVMLDASFNARLGDFGLARWMEHELGYETRTPSMSDNSLRLADTTSIGGTIGYLPPESFQKKATATAKSDVFSFGIVLLEIASGRRAVDLTLPDDQIILVDRVRRLADEKMVLQAADSRLSDGAYDVHEMQQLIHLGLLCTLHDPQTRPSMRWVVEVLSGGVSSILPDLPLFKSQPLYISVCRNTTSTTGTTTAATTTTITITTSFGIASGSSTSTAFASANEESLYITAQEHGDDSSSHGMSTAGQRSRRQLNPFLMVEPPREITYKEIISATENFSDANRLSEVDFGTAYYGVLDNHDVVIKRLGMKTCPALRLRFANELANLGRLRHRNLVQLRGWCTEQGEMLVVYDYSANRLLGQLLSHHNHRNSTFLRWNDRYNIVKSLACAIRYLHEEWEEQVIHRNITSSAIYIDPDMNPRLGSFALAEFLTRNEHGHHVVIDKKVCVRGIFGYMAPEYMELGEATPMADVYSFGVVVLEIVTGRMAVDFRRPEVLLVKKVHGFESRKGNYEEIVDPRLNKEYNQKELGRLVKLALACTQSNPDLRPTMTKVVSILDGNDRWLTGEGLKQGTDEWKEQNMLSLSLIRRMQALGIQ
ncbi:hypothetical protein QVD17_37695 [Tagetes erecta]|uniref:Protein kinase domain-containing protein n=1 Tax=Tagetes erecta TaxID=13708 RepID=A0AAD8NCX2_TARER|nr:hypothetical protein QVD17_37695 [Tagetes erecta]